MHVYAFMFSTKYLHAYIHAYILADAFTTKVARICALLSILSWAGEEEAEFESMQAPLCTMVSSVLVVHEAIRLHPRM
jgi:hypothetical protein